VTGTLATAIACIVVLAMLLGFTLCIARAAAWGDR